MDPPPPYDTVTRSSTSSSVRSVDRLNPDGTGPSQTQQPQTQSPPAPMHVTEGPGRIAAEPKDKKYSQDGGCCKSKGVVLGDTNGLAHRQLREQRQRVHGTSFLPLLRSVSTKSRLLIDCAQNYGDGSDGCEYHPCLFCSHAGLIEYFEAEDVMVLYSGFASMEISSSLAPLVKVLFTASVLTSNAKAEVASPFGAYNVICC